MKKQNVNLCVIELAFGNDAFDLPADMMKLILVLVLSKYFSRRHVEIRNIKHIFISGFYAFLPFLLVFLQPDFGSAMIIFFIWLGMVLGLIERW
jgi:rod shape determining protein RodA